MSVIKQARFRDKQTCKGEGTMVEPENALMIFARKNVEKWQHIQDRIKEMVPKFCPVVTVSMAPGSGGSRVAQKVADYLGFDYFDRRLLEVVADAAEVTPQVLESLEKERLSGVQDFIASLLDNDYVWPGVYLDHLRNMVRAIGNRGRAVIVGRGANFILPRENRLGVRVVAPLNYRINNLMRDFDITEEEAISRIQNREKKREAFVKKSFHQDIASPENYELVVNTETLGIDGAAEVIAAVWMENYLI